jgi:hypothetical protein
MKILCLHPGDDPESGSWSDERWDRVVDLGVAGEETRECWSRQFGCRVEASPKLRISDLAIVRRALSSGFGCVVDEHGLDWWELISIRFHEQIALILRLKKLAAQLSTNDQLVVTRPGFHATVLSLLLESRVRCFREGTSYFARARRLLQTARNLSCAELLQIVGDKYDAGYRVRRWLSHSEPRLEDAVVLLPVAQGNAARTALSYTALLPNRKFLLISTRPSGSVAETPSNVAAATLASYAGSTPGQDHGAELLRLLKSWSRLEWQATSEIALLEYTGAFSGITKMLRDGVAIRDAWLNVFERERVSAVLCTDDTNPYTHLPLLIARQRGLPTIACHHGALDGGHLVKRSHADVTLAKGRMEKDYLVNTCGLPEKKIEVGAPALRQRRDTKVQHSKSSIVFFSEPYALGGGRCRDFYRELLPPFVDLASEMNLKLLVKLHPMESERERRKIVNACLSFTQKKNVKIVTGALSHELLDSASFAVTIQSTAAVDCVIHGIPVFLCRWLDFSYFGYVDQLVRYKAGVPLHSRAEIANIPEVLKNFQSPTLDNFWQRISPEKLEQLLEKPLKMAVAL